MIYSTLGVPINAILIGTFGRYFGKKASVNFLLLLIPNHEVVIIVLFFNFQTKQLVGKKFFLYVLIVTVPGIAVFILLPSALFWQAKYIIIDINNNLKRYR